MTTVTVLEFATRLAVAVALGAAIGSERQWRQRMAGLRTNCLVSTGAALFVLLSAMTPGDASPTRIAAQVVSGIGFLGAGVIMRDGLSIRGLNTAATLWCSAAVGCLAGAGLLSQAAIGTAAIVAANLFLRPLARRIDQTPATSTEVETLYRLTVACASAHEHHVRSLLLPPSGETALLLTALERRADGEQAVRIQADFRADGRHDQLLEQAASRISLEPSVSAVRWELDPLPVG